MANATKRTVLLRRCFAGLRRNTAPRVSGPRLVCACLLALGALLLAGRFAQAATIHGGDILVVDSQENKLFRIDPHTGVRTVISDFQNPLQGPVGQSLAGVTLGRGKILVTAATVGIYAVDPHTGNRTLVSDFTKGAIHGDVFGAAVDASGRVIANWAPSSGAPTSIVRVNTPTDTRVVVSDLANPAQGDTFDCCVAYFTDLALERSGAIVAGLTWFSPVGPAEDVGDIYRVDPITGDRSLLSDFTNPAQGVIDVVPSTGIAVESCGKILVNSRASSSAPTATDLLLRIDPVTGHRAFLSDFDNAKQGPLGWRLSGIAVENSRAGGIIVGAGNPANRAAEPTRLFRVNPQTGHRALLSDSSDPKQGPPFEWIFEVAVVPENADDAGFHEPPPKSSWVSPFGAVR